LFRILASPDFQNTLEPWQNLRGILLGGASSNQELLNQCLELKLPILLTYGLTEATSQVATLSTEDIPSKIGSSGQVLSCNQVRIGSLRNDQVEVEIGAIGQILIKGDNLMKGYLNYPNLEDNWFNTGDIGYLDNAGYLYVLNRRHDLIISGGENIYPPEIESVLLKHPHIQDACIVGITDQEWGEIVAAVLQVSDRSINLDSVREFCIGEGLARYKLPKRIYIVDSMPTTASGKVSRQLIRDLITNLVS
jgi:O-succinylbenzoic acid--CoA ligase